MGNQNNAVWFSGGLLSFLFILNDAALLSSMLSIDQKYSVCLVSLRQQAGPLE